MRSRPQFAALFWYICSVFFSSLLTTAHTIRPRKTGSRLCKIGGNEALCVAASCAVLFCRDPGRACALDHLLKADHCDGPAHGRLDRVQPFTQAFDRVQPFTQAVGVLLERPKASAASSSTSRGCSGGQSAHALPAADSPSSGNSDTGAWSSGMDIPAGSQRMGLLGLSSRKLSLSWNPSPVILIDLAVGSPRLSIASPQRSSLYR